jgi:hypothetical protein
MLKRNLFFSWPECGGKKIFASRFRVRGTNPIFQAFGFGNPPNRL